MKKIKLNPTILLICGYGLGQGSFFLLQIALRNYSDSTSTGLAILYVSLFSLCFQFADFGNNPYGVQCYKNNKVIEFKNYRIGRALISVPILLIASCFFIFDKNIFTSDIYIIVAAVSIGGFVFGLCDLAYIEYKNNYFKLAFLQSIPWMITSFLLWFTYGVKILSISQTCMIWVCVAFVYYFYINKGSKSLSVVKNYWSAMLIPLAFLIPVILGQLWGRWMLILIATATNIEELGPLNLVRSVYTAGCLMIGFLIRPLLTSFINNKINNVSVLLFFKGNLVYKIFFLCCVTILFTISFLYLPEDIKKWIPILFGIPAWGLSIIISSINQMKMSPARFSLIDTVAMIVHIIAFSLLVNKNPVFAFVVADYARVGAQSLVATLIRRRKD